MRQHLEHVIVDTGSSDLISISCSLRTASCLDLAVAAPGAPEVDCPILVEDGSDLVIFEDCSEVEQAHIRLQGSVWDAEGGVVEEASIRASGATLVAASGLNATNRLLHPWASAGGLDNKGRNGGGGELSFLSDHEFYL